MAEQKLAEQSRKVRGYKDSSGVCLGFCIQTSAFP
jgi:hypothetical protein